MPHHGFQADTSGGLNEEGFSAFPVICEKLEAPSKTESHALSFSMCMHAARPSARYVCNHIKAFDVERDLFADSTNIESTPRVSVIFEFDGVDHMIWKRKGLMLFVDERVADIV